MDISRTADLWWKNAVFYCLDVETFQDGNGDGVGDFRGLSRRIDHLAGLGITCIWLMPFYPSPNRDDGYDIIDYYSVDPRLGSLGDFVEFMRIAKDRGIRVIADLVVNHTSSAHPWFQSARADPESPFRDWYIWRDDRPAKPDGLVFPGEEDSNWEWDEEAGQFYLHRFYAHQPDLNVANPEVREEIRRIVGFWMELGLSGFRVDAVPFLLEMRGTEGGSHPDLEPHDWLRDLRGFISRRRGDSILLGEVNLDYEEVRRFYGADGEELQMCLDFNMNQALALALVRGDAGTLVHMLRAMPTLPEGCTWAHFARNHDEWSLDKLTEAERQEVFRAFGPKDSMQMYGRGIRRRLPTMLKGDEDRLRMAYSLVFALPGAPVLFYGEEIGMAENLDIPGRQAVRAPMQWTAGPNGGFSDAPADQLRRPVVTGRKWGPQGINVAHQARDPSSLLSFMKRLVECRRTTPEIAFGAWSFAPVPEPGLLGLRHDWGGGTALTFHNLCGQSIRTQCSFDDIGEWHGVTRLLGNGSGRKAGASKLEVELPPNGLLWLRVERDGSPHG